MAYQIIATCPQELRDVVSQQMQHIGIKNIEQGYKAVLGETSLEKLYEAHLWVSSASTLSRHIKSVAANNPNMLFSQAKRIKWHQFFDASKTFRVDAICGDREDDSMPKDLISKKTREGIQDEFQFATGHVPVVSLKEPQVIINAFLRNRKVNYSLRTSGKSLHKRGYRLDGHPAPLKETLAAALIRLIQYDGKKPLFDPMCGSGSIIIEGVSAAIRKSPLIHRKNTDWGFSYLADFDYSLWRKVQEKARLNVNLSFEPQFYAADIDAHYVELAQKNALRARVEKYIRFQTQDFFESQPPCKQPGVILTNLPYDSRLKMVTDDDENASYYVDFYKRLGDHLKQNYKGWEAWFLVNEDSPWKHIGLKTKRKFSLLNGDIRTKLIGFDIF